MNFPVAGDLTTADDHGGIINPVNGFATGFTGLEGIGRFENPGNNADSQVISEVAQRADKGAIEGFSLGIKPAGAKGLHGGFW